MLRLTAALMAILAACLCAPASQPAPRRLLLVGQGPDGHPTGSHEYRLGLTILTKLLVKVPGIEVTVADADGPWREGPERLAKCDGVVLFLAEGAKWVQADPRRQAALEALAKRGGGLVALHWAIGTREAGPIDTFLNLLGGCHGGPDRKYKILKAEARPADPKHPVTAGLDRFTVRDEFYYRLKFTKAPGLRPVLTVPIDGADETVAWTWERPGGGRSFGFSGLHFHENWRLPEYRRLVAQGILWTLEVPIPADGLNVSLADKDLPGR